MERLTHRGAYGRILIERRGKARDYFSNYMLNSDIVAVRKLAYYEDLEEQGRLVVLPCKSGDTLYDIYEAESNGGGDIRELMVPEIHINLDSRNKLWLIVSNYFFSFEDFGKTVFLTRAEAEAAIKGGQHGQADARL